MTGIGSITSFFNERPLARLGALGALGAAAVSFIQDKALIGTACAAGAYAVYKVAQAYLRPHRLQVEASRLPPEIQDHILELAQPASFLRGLSKSRLEHQDHLLRAEWPKIRDIPWNNLDIPSPREVAMRVEESIEGGNVIDRFRNFNLLLEEEYGVRLPTATVPCSEGQIRDLYELIESHITDHARQALRRRILLFVFNDMMREFLEVYPQLRVSEGMLMEENSLQRRIFIHQRIHSFSEERQRGRQDTQIQSLQNERLKYFELYAVACVTSAASWAWSVSFVETAIPIPPLFSAMKAFTVLFGLVFSLKSIDITRRIRRENAMIVKHQPRLNAWLTSPAHLGTLGASPEGLGAIRRVHLDNYALHTVPSELTTLTGLQRLHLSDNRLRQISSELCSMTSLTDLRLDENRIEFISPGFRALTRLRHLNLHSNQLRQIPEVLCAMTDLEELCLSENGISELPLALSQLVRLRVLDLAFNDIAAVPEGLAPFFVAVPTDFEGNPVAMAL